MLLKRIRFTVLEVNAQCARPYHTILSLPPDVVLPTNQSLWKVQAIQTIAKPPGTKEVIYSNIYIRVNLQSSTL